MGNIIIIKVNLTIQLSCLIAIPHGDGGSLFFSHQPSYKSFLVFFSGISQWFMLFWVFFFLRPYLEDVLTPHTKARTGSKCYHRCCRCKEDNPGVLHTEICHGLCLFYARRQDLLAEKPKCKWTKYLSNEFTVGGKFLKDKTSKKRRIRLPRSKPQGHLPHTFLWRLIENCFYNKKELDNNDKE